MKRTSAFAAALAAASLAVLPGTASAQVLFFCGQVIDRPAVLSNDITGCTGDGLTITASGITVDLNGYTISGTGSNGILVKGSNVTVTNGRTDRAAVVKGFLRGVADKGDGPGTAQYGVTVRNLYVSARDVGVLLNARYGLVENVTTNGGGNGIETVYSTGTTIRGNKVRNHTGSGIFTLFTQGAVIEGNDAAGNDVYGIRATNDTTVRNNVSSYNEGQGIVADPGVIDGGGNVARNNGISPQCVNIPCS